MQMLLEIWIELKSVTTRVAFHTDGRNLRKKGKVAWSESLQRPRPGGPGRLRSAVRVPEPRRKPPAPPGPLH